MTSTDCIKVAVRIRPLVPSETEKGCQSIISTSSDDSQVVVKNNHGFTFNYAFGSDKSQEHVYKTAVAGMVETLFKGFHVTILAYGQTGSGKTHTMGTAFDGCYNSDTGIIPRVITDLFTMVDGLSKNEVVTVTCSFAELYQEQLYDLLSDAPNRESTIIDIREDSNREIVMKGLIEFPVNAAKDVFQCLVRGSKKRAVGTTAMNTYSSRSHAIFSISIGITDTEDPSNSRSAKFRLVDLAGSERQQKTKATGDRFKEGVKINQGLLALGNVISALGSGQNNNYVGYRDSKLTRLLQDSLGGNSVTLMIACVSPADYNMEESLSTLRYADRARKIKNKPILNKDPHTIEINRLHEIIQDLREQIQILSKTPNGFNSTIDVDMKKKITMLQYQAQETWETLAEAELNVHNYEELLKEVQQEITSAKEIAQILKEFSQKELSLEETKLHSEKLNELEKLFDQILNKIQSAGKEISLVDRGFTMHDVESDCFEAEKLDNVNKKQTEFRDKIIQISKELSLKEELLSKIALQAPVAVEDEADKIKEYETLIQTLVNEKNDLNEKLNNKKGGNVSAKLAEQRRQRLQQLEQEISELKKKNLNQSKRLKMKEKESEKVVHLTKEIESLKTQKVKLIRNLKSEAENFRIWKMKRDKEIIQLKTKEKKLEVECSKIQTNYSKQLNVWKRKFEESIALNKRLKDTLDKKNATIAKRNQSRAKKTENIQMLLDQELEIILTVADMKASVKSLMEHRAILNSNKDDLDEIEKNHILNLVADTQDQIDQMQQKILDADVENKIKRISDEIKFIPDARSALSHLFNFIIELRSNSTEQASKYRHQIETELMAKFEYAAINTEIKHREEIVELRREFEQKYFRSLRELNEANAARNNAGTSVDDGTERTQIEVTDELIENLERCAAERDDWMKMYKQLLEQSAQNKSKRAYNTMVGNDNQLEAFSDSDEVDNLLDNIENDPDWKRTPRYFKSKSKRRLRADTNTSQDSTDKSDLELSRCRCKTGCMTQRCKCRRNKSICSDHCKCWENCLNNFVEEENCVAPIKRLRLSTSIENPEQEDFLEREEKENISNNHEIDHNIENQEVETDKKKEENAPRYPYKYKQRQPFFN